MAKEVFPNEMVAHIWANQGQRYARTANGNFYVQGPLLYSYGSHFIVGVIDEQGRAWLNSDGYSMTTSKHKHEASYASRHLTQLRVPDLTAIADYIRDRTRAKRNAGNIRAYLTKHATALCDEAGAALLAMVSRGTWENYRARAVAAKNKAAAQNLARLKAHNRRAASAYAKRSIQNIRAEAIAGIQAYSTYALDNFIEALRDAHKAAGSPRIKAAVWKRLKAARAIKANAERYKGTLAARQALYALRAWNDGEQAGHITPESVRRSHFWRGVESIFRKPLAAHMPPATRAKLQSLAEMACEIANGLKALEDRREARRIARHETRTAIKVWRGYMERVASPSPGDMMTLESPATWRGIRNTAATLGEVGFLRGATLRYLWDTRDFADAMQESLADAVAAARARRQAMPREKRVAAWRAGENGWSDFNDMRDDGHGGALIRVSGARVEACQVIGGTLETSQGATVPLRHAAAIFAYVRGKRRPDVSQADSVAVWTRDKGRLGGGAGPRVGHFTLDKVYANGDFEAGCHRINWAETETLARSLGLWDCDDAILTAGAADAQEV